VHKTEHLHPTELLQHLDVPSSIWTDIAMDFIEGFPKMGGGGKSVMLTIVDHLSKYAHFIALGYHTLQRLLPRPSSSILYDCMAFRRRSSVTGTPSSLAVVEDVTKLRCGEAKKTKLMTQQT
jgi:hypothetical protein